MSRLYHDYSCNAIVFSGIPRYRSGMDDEAAPPTAKLGQIVRSQRVELGLSQEELAERIGDGITQTQVSKLERGDVTLPRRARMELIAAALKLPLGELLARSGWAAAEAHFPGSNGGASHAEAVAAARAQLSLLTETMPAAKLPLAAALLESVKAGNFDALIRPVTDDQSPATGSSDE